MDTKRNVIEKFRQDLKQVGADSTYSNQYLYQSLTTHAQWLIKREISAGRIYRNTSVFQTLRNVTVVEVPIIDSCLNINTKCKISRTKQKLPDMWMDNNGAVVKFVSSIDYSTQFTLTTLNAWQSKKDDPYRKIGGEKYCFISDGYLWFPEHNPYKININAFFQDDIINVIPEECNECGTNEDCVRFLDTNFVVPDWIMGEMYGKALQQIAGITERLQSDNQIDKNPTRKN